MDSKEIENMFPDFKHRYWGVPEEKLTQVRVPLWWGKCNGAICAASHEFAVELQDYEVLSQED